MNRRALVIASLLATATVATAASSARAAAALDIPARAATVDTEYAAHYSLVSSRIGKHRVSLRYEDFYVVDDDINRNDDDNFSDFGRVWMLAYRYNHSPLWSVGVEWLQVASWYPAWRYFGPTSRATDRLVQVHFSVRPGVRAAPVPRVNPTDALRRAP